MMMFGGNEGNTPLSEQIKVLFFWGVIGGGSCKVPYSFFSVQSKEQLHRRSWEPFRIPYNLVIR